MGEEGVSPRQRLVQAKQRIKTWEGEYKATYGCAPDREAMAQAPEDVRHAYKTYRHYRKAAENSSLHEAKRSIGGDEEALTHSSSGDLAGRVSCGDLDRIQEGTTGQEVVAGTPDPAELLTKDSEVCSVGERKDVSEDSCETKSSQITATASHSKPAAKFANKFSNTWGKHLNKGSYRPPPKEKEVQKETSLYSKMAENLRAKSTIKMRKSLSRTSSLNRSQSRPLLSRSFSQPSACSESNDASSELRLGCNGDSSIDKMKVDEEETLQESTSTPNAESTEVFASSFDGTVDELRPLSVFDGLEPLCNTTFSSSYKNTTEESRPLGILNTMEPNSCTTPPAHKNTSKPKSVSVLDMMELDSLEKAPKFHEISGNTRPPITQPISVLSALGQTRTSGLLGVKKRASLNLGWVARCTGTPVEDTIASEQTMPQDSWKMKLINKDWSEDNDKDEESQESAPITQDNDNSAPASVRNDAKPIKNTVKAVRNPRKKAANNAASKGTKKKVDPPLPTQSKAGRVLRTRSTRNAAKPNYTDLSDDEVGSVGGTSSQRGKGRGRFVDEDELWQDMGEREELDEEFEAEESMSNAVDEELGSFQSEPMGEAVCGRKRKKETIEELEEKGKIQCQWPPPKRKRIARKKAAAGGSSKKAGKENLPKIKRTSPKTKRTVKKRKKIEPEEEEEDEEEVDSPAIPTQSSNSTPSLEYDETEDIESHGTKTTKARGRYLTGEERMMKKISSGTVNNNFVRINLKKKVFVRGKKMMTGGKYRRQEWKKKQMMKSAESGNAAATKNLTCFKCGDFGHWARMCPGKRGDNLTPLEDYDENESTFLSLEEAASMAQGIKRVDSEKPVSKLYPSAKESEGVDDSAGAIGDDGTDMSNIPLPESQEEPGDGKVKEDETMNGEIATGEESKTIRGEVALSENTNQESTLGREGDTASENQNTDSQQTSNEAEYDFRDSDNDIFDNLEEIECAEQKHEAASSTPRTQSNTSVPSSQSSTSVPPSQSSYWQERPTVEPLYSLNGGELIATPEEVHEALRMFGYPSFRPGQEEAVMRILSGQSTLLVLSTGSGKSLCYQLPAYLYSKHRSPCITLCVSPLVSLMEDQTMRLPKFLRAVCLHTHQNQTQRSQAITAIHSRAAHILLVSPEAVVASRTGGVLGTLLKELPPVAFACLDEAHCVSEWSHNFRPSYLRVCQVLRERLGVKTILGLTATARTATAVSIARHLLISDFSTGVIRGTSVPDNLQLSVSRDRNREEALVTLLRGDRFSECSSIIIYCTRRDECERVATLIRTQLLDPSKVDVKGNLKRSRGLSFDAEAYHAGLSSHRRQQVQKKFMSGKLRIVVATVAFGMGIDKSDVRGIIHFNMPRNVESYVQEIGRAGRDGEEAHCHLFLDDQDGRDIQELKRHIFANSLDRHTIRKLLSKIFKPCTCAKLKSLSSDGNDKGDDTSSNLPSSPGCSSSTIEDDGMVTTGGASDPFSVATTSSTCPKHEVAIPIDTVVEELDLPEENLETLLCYLELHQKDLIRINSHVYANCIVSCYGGPRQLVAVSRKCPPLAVAIALERQKGTDFSKSNRVSFPVVEVASRMGWNSKIVKRELKQLEWNTQDLQSGGKVKRSGVMVEMTDLSFHLEARGDLSDDERDQVLDAVYRRTQVQEQDQLRQLHYTYQLLRSVSHNTILFCCDSIDEERCSRLRTELREYFRCSKALLEVHIEDKVSVKPEVECGIRGSVRSFLSTYEDQQWTGRAVARVFHGIGSPNYPTETWGRVRRYWRQHLNTDFNALVSIATQEILRCK
uniref:DNA 3'-5' helicase n=1 Tax=Scylla olivacea TaxID=85551 RepID=A0A0P4W4R4_SCYOL